MMADLETEKELYTHAKMMEGEKNMRKTRTRILSLLLALVMCLGLLPVTALAAEDSDTVTITFKSNYVGGGTCATIAIPKGSSIPGESLPKPQRDGYIFRAWYYYWDDLNSQADVDDPDSRQYLQRYNRSDTTYPSDATLYAEWVEIHTITFDANGGTVSPTSAKTNVEQRLDISLPTPVRAGHTFLGWFTGDSYQAGDNETWGGDQVLTAHWKEEELEPVRVNFYPNGGRITQFRGKQIPVLDAENSSPYIIDSNTAINQILGFGWTDTETSGQLADLPTVEREGYTFDGWYILGSGPETNSALDGTLTDLSGLEKFSATYKFTKEGMGLVAKWSLGNIYTVTFDLNGATGTAPAPQKVEKGKTVDLPVLKASGAEFKGWGHTTDGKTLTEWKAGYTVTGDLTLYAIWEVSDEDTYNFSNSDSAFDNYKITEAYFDFLTEDVGPTWKDCIRETFYGEDVKWGGSCFGMSAVYCMARGQAIDLSVFQSGTTTLRGLKTPRQSQNIQDLINFYMMAQSTIAGSRAKTTYLSLEQTKRYQKIVSDLMAEKGFSVLGFQSSVGGHAIVARSIQQSSDGYHIEIWDPNAPEEFGELVISRNFSSARFTDETYGAGSYNVGTIIKYIMPLSTRNQTYNAKDLRSVFGKGGNLSTHSSKTGLYLLSSSTGDFTLMTSDGRSAVVKDGVQVSGNLTLLDNTIDGGPNGDHRFCIEASDLDQVTITLSGKDPVFTFVSDTMMAKATADTLRSIVIDGDTVTTTCAAPAEQEITVVSDKLGSTWNKVTVSGKDTEFTVAAESNQLKVSSKNNVSVSVQGESVDTRKTSGKQTITASTNGTTVTMNSLESGGAPFTDVGSEAYYYDAVLWAVQNSVTSGTSATTFSPNDPCTRGQIVTFLWRAAGSPKPSSTNGPFTDVKAGAYYYDAVLWAVENGITSGTSATTFSPDAACTRGQTVTFLWRAAGSPKAASSSHPFADVKAGAYYYDAVLWAVEKGITSGTSATTFAPDSTVTRGQTVTFLYRSQGK